MLTLGLETSGTAGGIALVEDGQLLAAADLSPTGRRHARTLVAELNILLAKLDRSPSDCDGVAVSIGPGSFTGLRVGVVCAKTFAYAVGRPVVAVDTLEAIAAGSITDSETLDVVIDAMRGEFFAARFHRDGENWRRDRPIRILAAAAVLAECDAAIPLTGPGLARWPLDETPPLRLAPEQWAPRAEHIARIGARRALAGETDDLWTLEPLYIRRSAAEERLDESQRESPER